MLAISQQAVRRTLHTATARAAASQEAAVDPLARLGTVVTLAAGESLFAEGDDAGYYYKVVSGSVRSYSLMPDGRRQISDFFVTGDFFGLADLPVHSFSAEAITGATVIRYRRSNVDAQAVSQPTLARYLLDVACANLSSAREQMVLLGRKTAQERMASFLLSLYDRIGALESGTATIHLPMSRTDIADYLGLTTETVSRTLTALARRGLLALPNAHTIHLCDREELQEIAAGM